MESKHEDESNKQVYPEPKHDDNKSTTEGVILGLEVHPEAKHDDNEPPKKSTIADLEELADATQDDNKPAKEQSHSGLKLLPEEAKHNDQEATIEEKNKDSSSSSSSSSTSENSEELNSGEDDPLDDSFIKSDLPQSPRSECTSSPDVYIQTPQWSMVSASPRAGAENSFSRELLTPTPGGSMSNSSPMKSPLRQTMGRQVGYDPNRIPSSVFSAKPATPLEWSVASNESLFSIHMGNNSFSREYALMFGDSKLEEWTSSSSQMPNMSEAKSESNNFVTNLPPVFEAASENDKSVDIRAKSSKQESPKSSKITPEETIEQDEKFELGAGDQEAQLPSTTSNLSEGKGVTPVDGIQAANAPRVSNESGTSSGSFVFPVLDTNEGGKYVSLNAIAEKPEEPQSKPQNTQSTLKATCCRWFSCFSYLPRCC